MFKLKLFVGNDHAGVIFKQKLISFLTELNYIPIDVGSQDPNANDDYVDFAKIVSKGVVASRGTAKGILLCGTGTGMAIAANKIGGIRAGLCYDSYTAKMARYDNDSNILCLRARGVSFDSLKPVIRTWLKTDFSQLDRHKRRIAKLEVLSQK